MEYWSSYGQVPLPLPDSNSDSCRSQQQSNPGHLGDTPLLALLSRPKYVSCRFVECINMTPIMHYCKQIVNIIAS